MKVSKFIVNISPSLLGTRELSNIVCASSKSVARYPGPANVSQSALGRDCSQPSCFRFATKETTPECILHLSIDGHIYDPSSLYLRLMPPL